MGKKNTKVLISEGIRLARAKGMTEFSSILEFSKHCGLSHKCITIEKLEQAKKEGVIIHKGASSDEKKVAIDLKLKETLKRAKREGKTTFSSQSEFERYSGITRSALTDERLKLLKNSKITINKKTSKNLKDETNKKIEHALSRAIAEGITEFKSHIDFIRYCGVISEPSFKNEHLVRAKQLGIIIRKQLNGEEKTIQVEKKIDIAIQKALVANRLEFTSHSEFERYCGIGSKTLTTTRIERAKKRGITILNGSSSSKSIDITKKVDTSIKRAIDEGKIEFASYTDFAKYCDINATSLSVEHINNAKEKSVIVNKWGNTCTTDVELKEGIKRALSDGILEFSSKIAFAKYCGIEGKLTENHIVHANKCGISIVNLSANNRVIETDKKIDIAIKNALNENKLEFGSYTEFANYVGISKATLTEERIKRVEQQGFTLVTQTHEALKKETDQKIDDGIKQAKDIGKTVFNSNMEFTKFCGIGRANMNRERINKVKLNGITIHSPKADSKLFRDVSSVVHEANELSLSLENIDALLELSEDFLGKKLSLDNIDGNIASIEKVFDSIFKTYTPLEKRHIIENAASQLVIDDKPDFSIKELKLQLLLDGHYFSANTILKMLQLASHDTNDTLTFTMEKELRFVLNAVENGMPGIIYSVKLPDINTSKDGKIIVKKSIQNKKMFMQLWREYTLSIINNNVLDSISEMLLSNQKNELETLLDANPALAQTFLLGNECSHVLQNLSYEGMAALILFTRHSDNLPKELKDIHHIASGFFVWLNNKGLALSHPKYLQFDNKGISKKIVRLFTVNHPVSKLFHSILDGNVLAEKKIISNFSQKYMLPHMYKLVISTSIKADLAAIRREDISIYIDSSEHYASPSGTTQHSNFVYSFFYSSGNKEALKPKHKETLDEYFKARLLTINFTPSFYEWYKELMDEMMSVILFRYKEESISYLNAKKHIRALIMLFNFLSTFNHKLDREEMANALNPIVKQQHNMLDWAIARDQESMYRSFTTNFRVLFEEIVTNSYKGLYDRYWILKKLSFGRKLIRKGLEPAVLKVFQQISIYTPPRSTSYTFQRTARDGSQLDLSWWSHDISPIPVICNWLISKLPRRMMHIRWLDVNTFMQYDSDGQFEGIEFTTDKNRKSDSLFIPARLVRMLFSDEELVLLAHYIDYIKTAYSHLIPVEYESGGNYPMIQPLFPHHDQNTVIAENILIGYHNKVMLMTQIKVRQLATTDTFDEFYNEDRREYMRNFFSKIELIGKTQYNGKDLPKTQEEIDTTSDNAFQRSYATLYGIHNMRHAGATALLHLGLLLTDVKVITGHTSVSVLLSVYTHYTEQEAKSILSRIMPNFLEFGMNPTIDGNAVIRKIVMPLVENDDPLIIENTLRENGFMSLTRTIIALAKTTIYSKQGKVTVDNGLEIASKFHPDSTWECFNHGICTMKGHCPEGTNGVCSLCPHIIFNAIHIKGIIYQFETTLRALALLGNKLFESRLSGTNTARNELRKAHDQKSAELFGWQEMLGMVEEQLTLSINTPSMKESIATINNGTQKSPLSYMPVSIDQATMNILAQAKDLDLSDVETDNMTARLSHKIMTHAIRSYDEKTTTKMAHEGINWIIEEYGLTALNERVSFLASYLGEYHTAINTIAQKKKENFI